MNMITKSSTSFENRNFPCMMLKPLSLQSLTKKYINVLMKVIKETAIYTLFVLTQLKLKINFS